RLLDQLAPVPVWQQRIKVFPEELSIDDNGVTLITGIIFDTAGRVKKETALRRYAALQKMPAVAKSGVELAVAETDLPAWCDMIIADGVNHVNVLDFTTKEYHLLGKRELLQEVIPDLKKYGDTIETKVEFKLRKPFRFLDPAPAVARQQS